MGLLSGIGDVLSGGGISAGRAQRAGINAAMGNVNQGYGAAQGNITQGYGQAQGQLDQGYGQARTDLTQGTQQAVGALSPLANQSAGQYGSLTSQYNAGQFDPNNFNYQQSPGYQFSLNQGLDAIKGNDEASGLNGSGQEQKDLLNYATGAASQDYGNAYNRNLQAQNQNFNQGQTLAAPAFGLAGQISNLYSQQGQGLSGLSSQQGLQGAGLSTAQAGLLSGLNTDQAVNLANLNQSKGIVNGNIQQAGWSPVTGLLSQGAGKLLGGIGGSGGSSSGGASSGQLQSLLASLGVA